MLSNAYQARTDTYAARMSWSVLNPQFASLAVKVGSNEDITATEMNQWYAANMVMFKVLENVHFQNELGLVPGDHLSGIRHSMADLFMTQLNREIWRNNRFGFRAEFADWIDQIIQEIEQEEAAA